MAGSNNGPVCTLNGICGEMPVFAAPRFLGHTTALACKVLSLLTVLSFVLSFGFAFAFSLDFKQEER